MYVVNSSELRENQKAILDKVERDEQVIIKRGKSAFLITKLNEADAISVNPELIEKARRGMEQYRKGEYRIITGGDDL